MDELSIKAHIAAKTDVKNNMQQWQNQMWNDIIIMADDYVF